MEDLSRFSDVYTPAQMQRLAEQVEIQSRRSAAGIKFVSSYRGEADYEYQGRRFSVRTFANNYAREGNHYTAESWPQIIGQTGCIYWRHGGAEEFVPQEIAEHFPGYVRARYDYDRHYYVYDGIPPVLVKRHPWEVWVKFEADDHDFMTVDQNYVEQQKRLRNS